jgi:uncharacterized protein YutE (UPF0331/DUF86 family)
MSSLTVTVREPLVASLLRFLEKAETHPTVRLRALRNALRLADEYWSVDDERVNGLLAVKNDDQVLLDAPKSSECSSRFEEIAS